MGGFGATGGPAVDETPDDDPPLVSFVQPRPGREFDADETELEVAVEASDTGWGVASVALSIEPEGGSADTVARATPPYVWNAAFPAGACV